MKIRNQYWRTFGDDVKYINRCACFQIRQNLSFKSYMTRRFINQIRDNEAVNEVYRITEKQLRPNKNGVLYLQFNLVDKTGSMSGRIWNATEELFHSFENSDYVQAEGTTQRFQGALQFIGKRLSKIDPSEVDPEDFNRFSLIDIPKLRARLQELLRTLNDSDLLNLADCFLLDEEFMTDFCMAPAGVKLHHAYPGGLLEHTLTMMEVVNKIAPIYPLLNRDLLLIGALIHDIGKTEELHYENEMSYSSVGQMLGHPFIGVEILAEKIKEAEKLSGESFDPEKAMLLKHFIISHHGTLENGSAKVPMTLEAITLHFVDSLDSKIAEFHKYMFEDPNVGSEWTNYLPGIDRKLYKGRQNG